jgi:ATP-dependent Clp protease ATP-binding subunit ClpA
MFERFSHRAIESIMMARQCALESGSSTLETEDMLAGVLRVDGELIPKSGSGLTRESLANFFLRWRPSSSPNTSAAADLPLSDDVTEILSHSIALADEMECGEIRTEHLLLAMALKTDCHAAIALSESGADVEKMRTLARETKGKEGQPLSDGGFYDSVFQVPRS